jgi:putative hydrolase of the HAD superfamily
MHRTDPETAAPAAVIFDLGGVLIELDMEICARHWAGQIGMDAERMIELFWLDTDYRRLERGQIDLPEYHRLVNPRIGGRLTYEDFRAGWNGVFLGLADGALALLDDLAGQVRVVGLTNTNAEHFRTWSALYPELEARMERIFCSQQMGARKPEPDCFAQVLDWLDLAPGLVAFVDDRAENIEAAEAMGMRGLLARSIPQIREQLRAMGLAV